MKIEFLKKASNELEFKVIGEETILNPLKKELASDSSVSFVSFRKDHPLLEGMAFIVKGKAVKTSVKKAVASLKRDLSSFGKFF